MSALWADAAWTSAGFVIASLCFQFLKGFGYRSGLVPICLGFVTGFRHAAKGILLDAALGVGAFLLFKLPNLERFSLVQSALDERPEVAFALVGAFASVILDASLSGKRSLKRPVRKVVQSGTGSRSIAKRSTVGVALIRYTASIIESRRESYRDMQWEIEKRAIRSGGWPTEGSGRLLREHIRKCEGLAYELDPVFFEHARLARSSRDYWRSIEKGRQKRLEELIAIQSRPAAKSYYPLALSFVSLLEEGRERSRLNDLALAMQLR